MRARAASFVGTLMLVGIVVVGIVPERATSQDREIVTISSLEWPTGYGPPEAMVMLSRLVSESSDYVNMTAQETAGYIYNIKEMARNERRWKTNIFGTGANIFYLAENGVEPFFNEPIRKDWKHLFADEFWMLGNFITLDPSIKTPADFKGKKIALGQRTGSEWAGLPVVVMREGYGITEENADISFLDAGSAVSALLDGRVDVSIAGIITNSRLTPVLAHRNLQEVAASGRDFHYVQISEEAVDRIRKKVGAPYVNVQVPPNSLPQQGDRTLSLIGNQGWHSAHATFPEDVAYEITKAVIENAPKLSEYFAFGKLYNDPVTLTAGLTEENTHPGAIRAFKEAGLWPPEPAAYEQ